MKLLKQGVSVRLLTHVPEDSAHLWDMPCKSKVAEVGHFDVLNDCRLLDRPVYQPFISLVAIFQLEFVLIDDLLDLQNVSKMSDNSNYLDAPAK